MRRTELDNERPAIDREQLREAMRLAGSIGGRAGTAKQNAARKANSKNAGRPASVACPLCGGGLRGKKHLSCPRP